MAEEMAVDNGRISNSEGLVTLTLDHTAHHRASLIDLYLHAKFHRNRMNFLWTDGRTYGRTFETGFIRSTPSKSRIICKFITWTKSSMIESGAEAEQTWRLPLPYTNAKVWSSVKLLEFPTSFLSQLKKP